MWTVSIVDDTPEFCDFAAKICSGAPVYRVLETYYAAESALRGIPKNPPDVVLLDIGMKPMSGIELVSRLKTLLPTLKAIMITTFDSEDTIFDALQAGANGYVLKPQVVQDPVRLLRAIEEVRDGGAPMSPLVAQRALEFFRQSDPMKRQLQHPTSIINSGKNFTQQQTKTSENDEQAVLTKRELEVLTMIASGLGDKEIAEQMHVSVLTVRTHNANIYDKLQVSSRMEAVVKYFRQ